MLKYARHVPRSEEIVMAPATAQLVQLTISSELARRQNIPVPDMLPAAEIVVEAGRSFTSAAEQEAAKLSPDCSRHVRGLTKDLNMAGSDLMSVSQALRTDQSVALRTALRDSCFQYNLVVMKILLSLNGQKIKILKNCGEQLIAEIHSIPQSSGNMKTLVPLFKHFIEDLTQFCYRITDYHKEIKDKATRATVEQGLKIIKRTPTVLSNILQDRGRRSNNNNQFDIQLSENINTFVTTMKGILNVLNNIDVESATRYLELVLHASIAVAGENTSHHRNAITAICSKIIRIRSELAKLFAVTSQSSQSWNVINQLSSQMGENFSELNRILSQTYKSSEQSAKPSRPLQNLRVAAQKTYILNDPQLDKHIERFKQHANRLIDIAEYAVQESKEDDSNIFMLRKIAADISILGPKIIACALSVQAHPNENVTLAFMNAMCNAWSKVVARLLSIIDKLTNTGEFLRASESHINKDVALSKQAFLNQDIAALQRAADSLVNKAQRVFNVGQQELLKSTSKTFASALEAALADLEMILPRIIALTQCSAEDSADVSNQEELASAAHEIASAVHKIKTVVCEDQGDEVTTQVDAAKRLASALRGDVGFFDIGIQTYPENICSQGTQPPDVLLQFAMKEDSLDPDDINKLVGVKGIRKPPASINDAIISLADLIMTAMNGDPVESGITVLAAHCGRIKELSQQCHNLSDNGTRLRTIDFLVKEMNKLTPTVNDAARKTCVNTQDAVAIENLRWGARHWADSVIVLGKAFDDFGLAPTQCHQSVKVPSMNGLISAAVSGDSEMTEAELDSLLLRCTKQIDLATYCATACLSSSVAGQLDNAAIQLEDVYKEMSRAARALAVSSHDQVTLSHLEHLTSEWQEIYQELCTLVAENQPDTIPDETELGIPPSKVNIAIEQLMSAAKCGNRSKVQVLGNSVSAMTTKMRRLSRPLADKCEGYQSEYVSEVNEELLNITPEVIKYGLLVAADPGDSEFSVQLELLGKEWVDKMISLSNVLEMESTEDSFDMQVEVKAGGVEKTYGALKKGGDEKRGRVVESGGVTKRGGVVRSGGNGKGCADVDTYGDVERRNGGERGRDVETCADMESETTKSEDIELGISDAIQESSGRHEAVNFPGDLLEPIKAAGYRLARQGSLTEDGAELREIKSITIKLCDCLQVLSSTHTDVNERYEMEDAIEQVKSTVNQIMLMRPGELQGTVEIWLDSISSVTSYLDLFLDPLLQIVTCPKNVEMFSSAAERISGLVAAVSGITHDLQKGTELDLVTSEKDRDDVTLVMMTQSHVTKMTPALCDAMHVVKKRPSDALQRTKFEAIKYQWATKFKLLNIALHDVLGAHCSFPQYEDRTDCWVVLENIQQLLDLFDIISEELPNHEFSELVTKHKLNLAGLADSFDAVHLMDRAAYLKLETHVSFGVYCLNCAVVEICHNISCLVPLLNPDLLDNTSIEFDPVKLSLAANSTVDRIGKLTDQISQAKSGRAEDVEILKEAASSLCACLIQLSDIPTNESVLEYRQVYIEWLCLAKDLFGESSNNYDDEERNSEPNHEMEDVVIDGGQDDGGGQDDDGGGRDSFLSDKQFIPGARSELSGSQTFSELHFSEDGMDRSPQPTFVLHPPDQSSGDEFVQEDLELDAIDVTECVLETVPPRECVLETVPPRDRTTTPSLYDPLHLEYTDDPSQTATVVNDIGSLNDELQQTLQASIRTLEDELAPWNVEGNFLLQSSQQLLQHFTSISDTTHSTDDRVFVDLLNTATQVTDTAQQLADSLEHVECAHRACAADLQLSATTLPSLAQQLMVASTALQSTNMRSEGVEALLAPHVGGMVDCLVKLLRAAYHAHLARALTNTGDWRWASAYTDSDEDSVIV